MIFPMNILRLWSPFLDVSIEDLVKVTTELGRVIGDLALCGSWQKVREMLSALKDKEMVSITSMRDFKTWLITQVTVARGAAGRVTSDLPVCSDCTVYTSQAAEQIIKDT